MDSCGQYSKLSKLANDSYLTSIVNNSDAKKFVEYLQKMNCLPQKIAISSKDDEVDNFPGIQRVCHNSWCTQTHYMVYAEAGAVILVAAAAISVALAAATSAIDNKNEFDLSVELAAIMGNNDFSEKVKDFISSWIQNSTNMSYQEEGHAYC